jgi:hypothetical protein
VFTSSSDITELDGNQTLLSQDATSPYPIFGLSNGTYYYIIAAYNEHGYTLSNCIYVTIKTEVPEPFILSSSAEFPDRDGNFNLIWTISIGANNYSVFTSSSDITELDGNQTLLSQDATSPYTITGLSSDVYYYIVVAYNKHGYRLSNSVSIVVIIEEANGDGTIPGYQIFLLIAILGLVSSILVFRPFIKKNHKYQYQKL